MFTKIIAAIHHMATRRDAESCLSFPGADENGHFSLNEREKTTCQSPRRCFLIDSHSSWFSLITGGVPVKAQSEASEETLLPTWISGGKSGVPELMESQSLSDGVFFLVCKWWNWSEARANRSHPLPRVDAVMGCVSIPPSHQNPKSLTSVCLAG